MLIYSALLRYLEKREGKRREGKSKVYTCTCETIEHDGTVDSSNINRRGNLLL